MGNYPLELSFYQKFNNGQTVTTIRNRAATAHKCGVKTAITLKNIAERAETLNNGRIYFPRKAIRVEGITFQNLITKSKHYKKGFE
jgi:hypothetical protein